MKNPTVDTKWTVSLSVFQLPFHVLSGSIFYVFSFSSVYSYTYTIQSIGYNIVLETLVYTVHSVGTKNILKVGVK